MQNVKMQSIPASHRTRRADPCAYFCHFYRLESCHSNGMQSFNASSYSLHIRASRVLVSFPNVQAEFRFRRCEKYTHSRMRATFGRRGKIRATSLPPLSTVREIEVQLSTYTPRWYRKTRIKVVARFASSDLFFPLFFLSLSPRKRRRIALLVFRRWRRSDINRARVRNGDL